MFVDKDLKYKGCSIIFVNNAGEVLLFLRDDNPEIPYPDMWDIPGGHVEPGETPAQCIQREMLEEISLGLQDFFLFQVYDFTDRIEYTFWQKADLDISRIQLNEGQRMAWFSTDAARQIPLAYGCDRILQDFFDKKPFILKP